MIQQYENVLSFQDLQYVKGLILAPSWKWGSQSDPKTNPDGNYFWVLPDLIDNKFYSGYLFSKIKELTGDNLELDKIYFNGQTGGQEGAPHRDVAPHKEHGRTFLIYTTDNFKLHYGGGTTFYSEDEGDSVTFPYKYNRGLYFKNNVLHQCAPISRHFKGLRTVLAFKMWLKE